MLANHLMKLRLFNRRQLFQIIYLVWPARHFPDAIDASFATLSYAWPAEGRHNNAKNIQLTDNNSGRTVG